MAREYLSEIEKSKDVHTLRHILAELEQEIENLLNDSYENDAAERRAHDLELILRHGEHKLTQMLN
jgi:hypothetical protein